MIWQKLAYIVWTCFGTENSTAVCNIVTLTLGMQYMHVYFAPKYQCINAKIWQQRWFSVMGNFH